jgi:hypothetical protein
MDTVGDNRITRRAYHLAHSVKYFGWLAIEQELQSEGYSRTPYLLNYGRIREEHDTICAEARMGTYRAT